MRLVTVAAAQFACSWDTNANVLKAEAMVRKAAKRGANVVVLQELFETPYFPKDQLTTQFELARPLEGHPIVARFSRLARELEVVIPVSFFEHHGQAFFNSVVTLDATGDLVGLYRKSHIPEGPGYQEKYYFAPGDTGFVVCDTRFGKIGVGICWDQWFPEAARIMALKGAEMLLFPSAIGSEPKMPDYDSSRHWRRVMQGHAAANLVPLVAANRIGREEGQTCEVTFYGGSFVADEMGEVVVQAGSDEEAVITATFDLDVVGDLRAAWGTFRDRRPELYGPLITMDGDLH